MAAQQRQTAAAFEAFERSFDSKRLSVALQAFWDALPANAAEVHARVDGLHNLSCAVDPNIAADILEHMERYEGKERAIHRTFYPSKIRLRQRLASLERSIPDHIRAALRAEFGDLHLGLLPLCTYCSDTVYMVELFYRMKTLGSALEGKASATPAKVLDHLGPYAGVVVGLLRAGRAVRSAIAQGFSATLRMRGFVEQCWSFPPGGCLAARGLWVQPGRTVAALRHDNFASFSLTFQGAANVLDVYYDVVDPACELPLFLLAQQRDLLGCGLVTHPFYPNTKIDKEARDLEQDDIKTSLIVR